MMWTASRTSSLDREAPSGSNFFGGFELNRKFFVLGPLALLVATGLARADVSFSYVAVPQGTVTANSSVTVNLYLQEVDTGGSQSLIASEGGLYAAGVTVAQTGGSGTTISAIAANSQAEPNGFSGNDNTRLYNSGTQTGTGSTSASTSSQSNQASLADITANSATVPPGPSGTTAGGSVVTNGSTTTTEVFLGTVTIGVGATANATYTVEGFNKAPAGTFDAGTYGNTLTATNLYDLDSSNNNDGGGGAVYNGTTAMTFTISTAAVPEPSSMVLSGLFIPVAGLGVWLRRRKVAVTAA